MKWRVPKVVSILIYPACGLAGWALVAMATLPTTDSQVESLTGRSRVHQPTVLEQIFREAKSPVSRGQSANPAKRATELKAQLSPAADRAAAAREALSLCQGPYDPERVAEATVRLYQWMQTDPQAAFAFLSSPEAKGSSEMKAYARLMFLQETETPQLLSLLENAGSGALRLDLLPDAGARLGATKDGQGVKALCGKLEGQELQAFQTALAKGWPPEDTSGLLALARNLNSPQMAGEFLGKLPFEKAMELWKAQVAENSDPEFNKGLATIPAFTNHYLYSSQLPLEERLAGAQQFSGGEAEGGWSKEDALKTIAASDLSRITMVKDGAPAVVEFGSGALDASAVLEAARQQFPKLADAAPDALRQEVFRQLAAVDAQRALTLLDGLPTEEKSRMAYTFLADGGGVRLQGELLGDTLDPRQAYALLQALPAGSGNVADARAGAWDAVVQSGYEKYGAAFTTWVETLPDNQDRRKALELISQKSAGVNGKDGQ